MTNDVQDNQSNEMSDRRENERTRLSPKLAKVICQTGEYLCFPRDVSELGTGLGFMHAVPPEPRILLQLANGLIYPIERVWIGKRQAGYRFGCEVSVEEFTGDDEEFDPRPIRLDISAAARVSDGRTSCPVKIINLSCEGARFESETEFALERLLGFSADGLDERLGELRWRDGKQFGMQFQHPLSVLELAECAVRLQPFGSPFPHLLGDALDKARAA